MCFVWTQSGSDVFEERPCFYNIKSPRINFAYFDEPGANSKQKTLYN